MAEQKKHDNSNVRTLRASPRILQKLEEREETGKSTSSVMDRDLGRYYFLLEAGLPPFTIQEARILVNATNGHHFSPETVHLLWAVVADWLHERNLIRNNLVHPDATDYQGFIDRLHHLSRTECMAIADAVERIWNSPTYHIDNMEERIRKAGLVKDE